MAIDLNRQTAPKPGDGILGCRGDMRAEISRDRIRTPHNRSRGARLCEGRFAAEEFRAVHADLPKGFATCIDNHDTLRLADFFGFGDRGTEHCQHGGMGQFERWKCEVRHSGETPFTLR